MHAKSYISPFTAKNPSSFYGRMFFGSLRETEENASDDSESDLDTSSEFSFGSHTERI